VQRFHQERKTKLSLILDSERWKQADVPEEFERLVAHISDTGKRCPLFRKLYHALNYNN
jgi:vacuolar protein sorting-associated protein 54